MLILPTQGKDFLRRCCTYFGIGGALILELTATMVSTLFGYEIGTKVAHFAMDNNLTCKEAAKQLKLLPDEVVEDLFDVHNLVDMDKLEELFGKYQSYRKV